MSHPRHHLNMPDEFWTWLERNRAKILPFYYDIIVFRRTHSRSEAVPIFKRTVPRIRCIELQYLNRFKAYRRSPFYPYDTYDEHLKAGRSPDTVPLMYLHLSTRANNILQRFDVSDLGALLRLDLKQLKHEPNCGVKTIKEISDTAGRFRDGQNLYL